jgi:type IV pilus assembly protein PilA
MDERGFTLVELLVAVLIIGMLAAIALPTFLGQSDKARDAAVKTDVRNAVTQMESCYTARDSYNGCPSPEEQLVTSVVPTLLDSGARYRVEKISVNTGTTFIIVRLASGYSRICTQPEVGGCDGTGHW